MEGWLDGMKDNGLEGCIRTTLLYTFELMLINI